MLGVWLFIGWCVFMFICIVLIACFSGSSNSEEHHRGGESFIDWIL